jgi:head-tail adaptor
MTKIYTKSTKINSVSALIIALTYRCCKHSTVQFKCQVQDRVFKFCGRECTVMGLSLLSAKVNSLTQRSYTIFLHVLTHNEGSPVSELHNTQRTWAMVAELQEATSISAQSEMSINQHMRPRWPSMKGTVDTTSASTATIEIVICSWKNKRRIILLIRPQHTLILGWCNHTSWVQTALPRPKFSNCSHSLFTECRNLFHY